MSVMYVRENNKTYLFYQTLAKKLEKNGECIM